MNNEKIAENKKEDSRAFKKFILVTVLSALVGSVIGFASAFMEGGMQTVSALLLKGLEIVSPFATVVLATVLVIVDAIIEKDCRKMFAGWDGEDEELVNCIEMKLSCIMTAATVNTILVFFFFGTAAYSSHMGEVTDKAAAIAALTKVTIAIVGLIYAIAAMTLIQKRIVNFEKEINPEKNGSVYDPKFRTKWMESCDEGEKLQIYKSAYKSYVATQMTCTILWITTVIGMISFDFGLLPMTCVTIIWLIQSLSYCLESIRLSKHPSDIMK